jgi:hypothetical protein
MRVYDLRIEVIENVWHFRSKFTVQIRIDEERRTLNLIDARAYHINTFVDLV